jgi:hypothetical protein
LAPHKVRFGVSAMILGVSNCLIVAGGICLAMFSVFGMLGWDAQSRLSLKVGAVAIALGGALYVSKSVRAARAQAAANPIGMPIRMSLLWVRIAMLLVMAVPIYTTVRAQLLVPAYPEGFQQASAAFRLPWVSMAMSDLFCGFFAMSVWIVYRERNLWLAFFLIGNLWFWGNMLIGFYVFCLTFGAHASVRQILLGRHNR